MYIGMVWMDTDARVDLEMLIRITKTLIPLYKTPLGLPLFFS